jgi:hypothetical protein
MRNAFGKAMQDIDDGSSGPAQEEARKRYQGYNAELQKRAEVVSTLITSGKLVDAAKEINALAKAVRYVGNFGKEFMVLGNKIQSFVEEKAADDERITNTNLIKINTSFEELVSKTEAGIHAAVNASANEPEIDPARQLQRFDATKTQLVKELMDVGYVVAKAPVIVVTTPFLRADVVKQYFNAELFQGYVILKGQMVIGVTPDGAARLGNKAPTKKAQKLGTGIYDKALNEILSTLNDKYKSAKYVVAGTSHERFRAAWIWVMRDKDLNLLRTCTSSGNLKIDKWDLSFSGV